MLEFFYSITIFPLEFIMQLVLQKVYLLTGSYGKSLIAVSAVVSIGVLPFYHVAEKWQDAERTVQRKMKAKIDEFKSVLSGYELHASLHTLYRQHNYHPIYAARTSVGILIQIPFFLAAYQLLSHYDALNNISFWFVRDLGKADGLIQTHAKENFLASSQSLIISSLIASGFNKVWSMILEILSNTDKTAPLE